jgi:hypothetical protein
VIHLCDTIIASVRLEYCLIIDDIFITRQRPKKVIETLRHFVIVAGAGNQSGEHFFYLELRNSKLKFTKARSDAAD